MIWVEGLLNDQALLKWIIDISLKATLLLLIAGGITYLLRQASAATRHWVWSFGLFGVLLVPILSMMLPSWNLPILPEITPVEQRMSVQPDRSETALTTTQSTASSQRPPTFFIFKQPLFNNPVVRETESQPAVTKAPETTSVIVRSEAPKPAVPVATPSTLAQETAKADVLPSTTVTEEAVQPTVGSEPFSTTQWILVGVAVWSLGFIFILGRLLMGMLWIRWMSRKAQPVTDVYWVTLCSDICERFQISRPVRLWKGTNATTPMTWGVFRPVVLLPEESKDWSEEKCRVVLMHELAHVKRKDTLTQMIAQVACALFWFNPLVWVAAYKLRVEREHACDDQVLQLGTLASDYAGHLLDIARSLRSAKVASLATIAMARRSQLEGRLLAILDPKLNRRALSPMVIGFIAIVMVVVMLPLAAIQPWAPVPGDEVALASIEDHNESRDEFVPTSERLKLIEQNKSEAPQPSLDLMPAIPEATSDDANVFVDVAQQIDKLKHFNEGSGGGAINEVTLDQQLDVLIEKVGALLHTTTMHLTLLSQLFNEGEENAEEQVRARIQDYSVIYDQIMAELNQVLDDIEANHPELPAEAQLKQRFKAELREETKALTDAALHLVDAIDVYVEIKLTDELGLVGEALSGVVEIVSKQIKVEIQMELSQLLENLVMLDSEAGTRIIIINPSTADINITIDADDLADEWRHLIAGAKEFFKEFGKEMKNWSKDWNWDWDEDFEENMEALGEEFGEELGEQFGKDMEAWGETFGEEMEAWGESFGKDMEAWGENFEEDMQEWAEEFEAEMRELEEHHHDHNHQHEEDSDNDGDGDSDNDNDSQNV